MNFATLCAQVTEAPQEVHTGPSKSLVRCQVTLPPATEKKKPTVLNYSISWGDSKSRLLAIPEGGLIYIHGCQLHYSVDTREHSIHGGTVTSVTQQFPIFNSVILSGRCIRDMNSDGERPTTRFLDNGLQITEQGLAVNRGRESDLFNLTAYNYSEDRYRPAELLAAFTSKGKGLTVEGRITTDGWKDKTTGEDRSKTYIVVNKLTLGPKTEPTPKTIEPSTTVSTDQPASLWGGKTADQSLPDLPMPF